MFYAIRQIFLKGGTIKDAIHYVFKATGKMPTKSEGMKIINVYQDVQKHSGDVIQFPKERITPFHKPRPTEAELKAKFDKQNKETAERIRQKRYDAAIKAEKEKAAKDPNYIPDIIDPEDFASGGIAGQLHLNDGGRARYQHGSRQPGFETATSTAKQEAQQRDIRGLQRTMADRGGGDAQAYVREHNLNRAIADRKKLIESLLPKGPLDRHPGTGKMPIFPNISPFRNMFLPELQKRQYLYENEEDIPEGVLELLKKDPSFNLEEFQKIGWSMPENVWDKGGQGLRGIYYENLPIGIKVPTRARGEPPGEKVWNPEDVDDIIQKTYVTPSGPPSERVWDPEKLYDPTTRTFTEKFFNPVRKEIDLQMRPFKEDDRPMIRNPNIPTSYVDESRMSNTDKARIALHEMRHKKFVENPEFWKSQPLCAQIVEMPRTTENIQFGSGGHELYNRFLDQRYFPPMRDPGSEPYFDKILKDLWEPSAKEYERILEARDLGERYAKGGLAHVLGV